MIFEKNLRTFEIFHHENSNSNDLNDQFKPFIAQIWLIMPKKAKKWPFCTIIMGIKLIFLLQNVQPMQKRQKHIFFTQKIQKIYKK